MINFLNRIICYKEVKLRCWAWIEPQENITVNQVFNKVIKEKDNVDPKAEPYWPVLLFFLVVLGYWIYFVDKCTPTMGSC